MYVIKVEFPAGTRMGPGGVLEIVSDALRKEFNKRNEVVGRISVQWTNTEYDRVEVCPDHDCRTED